VHMAHHRQEFGPNEPDIALYANYPVTRASFWRKMRRDAFGKTGWRLLRQQLRDAVQTETVRTETANTETVHSGAVRYNTQRKIFAIHFVAFLASVLILNPYIYFGLWLPPYLTVWRVMNRLRSIAEHGGLRADSDRRVTTHSVRQHWLTRFYFVPFNLGWHIAHHLDAGIPFRSLPDYHKQLRLAGFVSDVYEYRNYRQLWRALRSRK
jgi:fatty acid desaturase